MKKFLKFKNWYSKTRYYLIKIYKKDYKLFSALLASTSPRFQIKRNYNTAKKIYFDFIQDKKSFILYFAMNKKQVIKYYKLLPCHYNNILKSLIHYRKKQKKKFSLNGLKVDAFYQNLIGNYSYIVLDVWMLKYFNIQKNFLNKSDYKYYSKIIKKYFKKVKYKYNLKNPSQLQAVIWEYTRSKYGLNPSNFVKHI